MVKSITPKKTWNMKPSSASNCVPNSPKEILRSGEAGGGARGVVSGGSGDGGTAGGGGEGEGGGGGGGGDGAKTVMVFISGAATLSTVTPSA